MWSCKNVNHLKKDKKEISSLSLIEPNKIVEISQPKTTTLIKDSVKTISFSKVLVKPIIKEKFLDDHMALYSPTIKTILLENALSPVTKKEFLAPKTYIIPKTGYTIKYGDTIYPPTKIPVKYPQSKPLEPMRSTINSIKDIKFLNQDMGLPTSNFRCVIEDNKDYLWFGTIGKGLIRYNGNSYLNFNKNNGLNINYVNCLLEDQNKNIWIGSKETSLYENKIIKFDGYHFYDFNSKQGFTNHPIRKIFQDSKGAIWFATEGDGVFIYKKNKGSETITKYTTENGLLGNFVFDFWENPNGDIWIGTESGINIFDGENISVFSTKITSSVKSIIGDKYNNVWFADKKSIYRYNGNSIVKYKEKNALKDISDLEIDNNGFFWISNWRSGLSYFDGNKFGRITNKNGLIHSRVPDLTKDNSNNIWFTTPAGIHKLKVDSFDNHPTIAGMVNRQITGFSLDASQNLWISSREYNGIVKYDYENYQHYFVENARSSFVYTDSKNNLWFGAKKKDPFPIFKFDGNIIHKYKINGFEDSNKVMDVIEDKDGVIWVASLEGLFKLNENKIQKFTEADGVPNKIMKLAFDEQENLWLCTKNGLTKFSENGSITYTEENGLRSDFIRNFIFDSNGNIFISTDKGLSMLEVNKADSTIKQSYDYGEESYTAYEYIFTLLEDKKNHIWVSNEMGVNRLSPTNTLGTFSYLSYTKKDGFLAGNGILNSIILDSRNTVWWGSRKGTVSLDLNEYEFKTKQPKIHIDELEINQEFIDFQRLNDTAFVKYIPFREELGKMKSKVAPFANYPDRLKLPYNLNHLKFKFSGTDWKAPDGIRYVFKLKGADDNKWSELTTDNFAEYRNIKAGEYSFQVKAIGKTGFWSETETCNFSINPPWWATIWVKILYFLIGVFVIYAIVSLRLKTIRKKFKEKEALWKITNKQNKRFRDFSFVTSHNIRIASANLIGLHNLLEKDHNPQVLNMLEATDNKLRNSIEHMNQLLSVDDFSVKTDKRLYSIKKAVDKVLKKNKDLIKKREAIIKVNISEDLKIHTITNYIDNVLHQIIKNALFFGVTPSNKIIEISAKNTAENTILYVKDYGLGIDLGLYREKMFTLGGRFHPDHCDGEGLGLYISKNQMKTLGGDIKVESFKNKGSTFMVLFYDNRKEDIIS